ncbi:MAG: hypothetical protein ACKO3T_03630 [Planctomycetaceae bacterium]
MTLMWPLRRRKARSLKSLGAEYLKRNRFSAPKTDSSLWVFGAETVADDLQKASDWLKNRSNQQDLCRWAVDAAIFSVWHRICSSRETSNVLRRSSDVLNY